MPSIKTFTNICLLLITTMSLFSCSGQRPTNLGITDNKLPDCPASPNCVSSDASDARHKVLAIKFSVLASDAWELTKRAVVKLPRTQIVSEAPDYLHAECTSAIFGFIDDLELQLRPAEGIIAIRSASRLGDSDFGVNRERVETLRSLLDNQELILR